MSLYVKQSRPLLVEGAPNKKRHYWAVFNQAGEKVSPDYFSKYAAKEQMSRLNLQQGKASKPVVVKNFNEPDGAA